MKNVSLDNLKKNQRSPTGLQWLCQQAIFRLSLRCMFFLCTLTASSSWQARQQTRTYLQASLRASQVCTKSESGSRIRSQIDSDSDSIESRSYWIRSDPSPTDSDSFGSEFNESDSIRIRYFKQRQNVVKNSMHIRRDQTHLVQGWHIG